MNERLLAELSYEWLPFTFAAVHLTFAQHCGTRLESSRCSHWGPAVYKWEGAVSSGPNSGKVGVLIGETDDLRQRIKAYISGTQERGNRLWRETFLQMGDIRLWVLRLRGFSVQVGEQVLPVPASELLGSNNRRLVVEQLLVMRAVHEAQGNVWVVNARQ